jgi:hypothetical protein
MIWQEMEDNKKIIIWWSGILSACPRIVEIRSVGSDNYEQELVMQVAVEARK